MPLKVRFIDNDEIPVLVTPTTRTVRDKKDRKAPERNNTHANDDEEQKPATRTPRRAALKAQEAMGSGIQTNERRLRTDSVGSDDSGEVLVRQEESFDDMEVDSIAPYTAGEGLVSGGEVYNFNTPSRRGQPRSVTTTPSVIQEATTPTSARRVNFENDGKPEEGSRTRGRRKLNVDNADAAKDKLKAPATPERKGKQRLKQRIQKLTEDMLEDLSSSSGSEFEPSDSESASEASDEEEKDTLRSFKNVAISKPFQRTPGRPTKNRPAVDSNVDAESYFKSQFEDNLTSNRTLARLKQPRLEKSQVDNILKNIKDRHVTERNELIDEHRSLFPKWLFLLGENYNILLYGFGSKSSLIEEFHQSMLPDEDVLIINGFFPSLTVREILNCISCDILEIKDSVASNEEQVKSIEDRLRLLNKNVYLLVNNIDGSAMQNEKCQVVLSTLAGIYGVRLIASIDHLNAPLLWDHSKLSRFRFLWFDVTTFLPYTNETAFESSLMVQSSTGLALSSLAHVFASLTPNAKKIFCLIANFQLENEDSDSYKGLAFQELYRMCREAFLVNSDVTLRAQLTEFRDHKLLKSKRSAEGLELLVIPLDSATITEFLSQLGDGS